jgi:hypothetical protein
LVGTIDITDSRFLVQHYPLTIFIAVISSENKRTALPPLEIPVFRVASKGRPKDWDGYAETAEG